jgi:hypothetical protein
MGQLMRVQAAFAVLGMCLSALAGAHSMTMTQVLVSFGDAGAVEVKIDIDLTLLLGSAEGYYEVVSEAPEKQAADIQRLVPRVIEALPLFVGRQRLPLVFRSYSVIKAQRSDYLNGSTSNLTTMNFVATLPGDQGPLKLVVPIGAEIDYPIAYTVQIPSQHLSITRWLENGIHDSEPFSWAGRIPDARGSFSHASQPALDPDSLSWPKQALLYLRLGFHHIVPEGADHILFVLGLFFLGVTWRKLLSQTTVFTVAHATTLFLSTYGIFRLPSRIVEPAIALSIAWIAIENIVKPKLGPGRLAIVFCFGLVHGLGFASSLSNVPFPKHQFIIALLGFNFGVDFGQLFVIALAFLAVGWFRNKVWFRPRIAIPCSLVIAATGIFWAAQRLVQYAVL